MYSDPHDYLGYARLLVYGNHRKNITVCDMRADPVRPGLEIDPVGAGPPDTLVFDDHNGSNAGCVEQDIGYSVRKWRVVAQQSGGVPYAWGDWQLLPLPYNGY